MQNSRTTVVNTFSARTNLVPAVFQLFFFRSETHWSQLHAGMVKKPDRQNRWRTRAKFQFSCMDCSWCDAKNLSPLLPVIWFGVARQFSGQSFHPVHMDALPFLLICIYSLETTNLAGLYTSDCRWMMQDIQPRANVITSPRNQICWVVLDKEASVSPLCCDHVSHNHTVPDASTIAIKCLDNMPKTNLSVACISKALYLIADSTPWKASFSLRQGVQLSPRNLYRFKVLNQFSELFKQQRNPFASGEQKPNFNLLCIAFKRDSLERLKQNSLSIAPLQDLRVSLQVVFRCCRCIYFLEGMKLNGDTFFVCECMIQQKSVKL